MADINLETKVAVAAHASDVKIVRREATPGIYTLEVVNDDTEQEIATARGTRPSLDSRLTAIADFAAPFVGNRIVGQYYDNSMNPTAPGTVAGVANRVDMSPFMTSRPLRIDQLGIAISTAVASSAMKVFIYSANDNGYPDQLLYEGPSDLSGATTGFKSHTLDFTFEAGRLYWIGVKMNSTATYRALALASCMNLGIAGSNGTSYYTVVRRSLTYANPLPASWNFVTGDLVAGATPASIRMRAAA